MGVTPNNKVSTEKFYEALLKQNELMAEMERRQNTERKAMELRVMDELKGVPTQVKTNKDEIGKLRIKSYMGDGIVTTISLFAAYLSGYLRGE